MANILKIYAFYQILKALERHFMYSNVELTKYYQLLKLDYYC